MKSAMKSPIVRRFIRRTRPEGLRRPSAARLNQLLVLFAGTSTMGGTTRRYSAFPEGYELAKVWEYKPQGGTWGSLNKPTAGPQSEKELPKGKHPLQLHSMATPNGVKATILLEELHDAYGLEYDAYPIKIGEGDQFTSGFVEANPNSKIPALLHYLDEKGPSSKPRSIFESGAILMYLCEHFDKDHRFLPTEADKRAETLSWLFWQMGSAPYLGGGFGHFYHYAPVKIEYAIDRFTMETKRQLDVLERHLSGKDGRGGGPYMVGDTYTIADMAIWPWYGSLVLGRLYGGSDKFLQVEQYPHVLEWAHRIDAREAVRRGQMVNKLWGEESEQLPERHSAKDFEAVPTASS
mmetsp:Transcript_35219/g.68106  ORF Transcript_35219/g.68106 Transcript_35219/m.68106 type:complete len:350 (-) Transcript_35219:69-1118(-)